MMIDTHCHLGKEYYEDIETVIKNMGNNIIIVSGTNYEDNKEVIELCNKYPNIYGTIGYYPEYVEELTDKDIDILEGMISNHKIVGVGEIGLDYHYSASFREKQKEMFIKQMELARKYKKAAVIHSRDAIEDTYDIIKNYTDVSMIMHCYSSSLEMAYKFTELGVCLGIGGVVTFKNGKKLKEVVKGIDLKYLVLETDSPYLTPEPFRGKVNEPCNILYVAKEIASIKGMSLEEVLKITSLNASRIFDLSTKM